MKKIGLQIILSFLLLSCGRPEQEIVPWTPKTPDVGTLAQHDFVSDAVQEIQNESDRLGFHYDFSQVPIRVVQDFSMDTEATTLGLCYEGEGAFIEIKDSVFNYSLLAWAVLAHELGHCVLNRSHSEAVFDLQSKKLLFVRDGMNLSPHGEVASTVMSNRGVYFAPKMYYIRELLGVERLSTATELMSAYPADVSELAY